MQFFPSLKWCQSLNLGTHFNGATKAGKNENLCAELTTEQKTMHRRQDITQDLDPTILLSLMFSIDFSKQTTFYRQLCAQLDLLLDVVSFK